MESGVLRVGIEATCPPFSGEYMDPAEEKPCSEQLLCLGSGCCGPGQGALVFCCLQQFWSTIGSCFLL